jgi:hypothetical protein
MTPVLQTPNRTLNKPLQQPRLEYGDHFKQDMTLMSTYATSRLNANLIAPGESPEGKLRNIASCIFHD